MAVERVDLEASNTIPFVFTRVLVTWDALYDLYNGEIRAHMRVSPENLNVLYEWYTDKGNLTVEPTKAIGIFDFVSLPLAGDTIKLGETTVTFVSGAPGANQVQIDTTITGTVGRTLTMLNASTDDFIELCTYTRAGNSITAEYDIAGFAGNNFVIGASAPVTRMTVSGETLEGGGALLTMTASVFDIKNFSGDYWYDVRFENELGPQARLFEGVITWKQGVTR